MTASCLPRLLDDGDTHGLINYTDTEAKCGHLNKMTSKGTVRKVFICLRPPPLVGLCLGWSSDFVGSESGKLQIVKLLQIMVRWATVYKAGSKIPT